jgi:hypothetical protein
MSAPKPQLIRRLPGGSEIRTYLRVARCPGCECDPQHPTARTCDRIGCPIKHMSSPVHEGCNAA